MNPYQILRPLLFKLDAECAHNLTLNLLQKAPFLAPKYQHQDPISLMGLTFPNRLGLAAGLDKNGVAIKAFDRMGFGFIEIGTATPKAQEGNPKPRLYRVKEQQAIINRMGFNNLGIENLIKNLIKAKTKTQALIGVNIGKNKNTANENAIDDYLFAMRHAYPYADYISINISSPNTQGLRALQEKSALSQLLNHLKNEQIKLKNQHQRHCPLVLKIAPDNNEQQIKEICQAVKDEQIDGIIATNTTIDKSALGTHPLAKQEGGLSGAPLYKISTEILKQIRSHLPNIPLIASGGVMQAEDYQEKRQAGADLVQIYTGLIYQGPKLIKDCLKTP